jgi:anti-sigma B factor antagonist
MDVGLCNEYIIFPNGIILIDQLIGWDLKGKTTVEVMVKSIDNCELVSVNGRVDSYTAPQLSEALDQITSQNMYKIIMDLSEVTYISSAGLRILIDVQKKCKKNNQGEVLLVSVPQRVYDTLELAGFVPLFKFFTNVASAIAAFQ